MTVAITGVIQAGGKSTRMGGEPKALLELGGRRIIERVLDVLRAVTADPVLLVTNTPGALRFLGLPMIADVFPDGGSLGGIYSGLRAAPGDVAFTVACDMPFLSSTVARLVTARAPEADVVAPRVGEQWETLHACYGKACLGPMERAAARGTAEDHRVLRRGARARDSRRRRSRGWPIPRVVFMNVNTPEELARARALVAAG